MDIQIVKDKISSAEVKKAALESFGEMVKAVVDVEQKIMALGGELHGDAEAELLKLGSKQDDLWGINIYPDLPREKMIEFTSLINIRPSKGNKTMEVEDEGIRTRIKEIVNNLIE